MKTMGSISEKIIKTPCYVVDESLLKQNLEILSDVQKKTGVTILLALKGFAMFSTFPVIREYLSGTSASSLDEARLGAEEFGGEVHICAPGYTGDEFGDILKYSSHVIFNSFSQWQRYKNRALAALVKCGLRINPEHSEVKVPLYDPCRPGSRLGLRMDEFKEQDLSGISGLHFHTLCELNSDSLQRTLVAVEKKFANILHKMEWVNFGGGHHITREDYDVDRLCRLINEFKEKYGVKVYLEPGEAIALGTGVLVATVIDIVTNDGNIAILDTSAAAHMPDVLEMPYRPEVTGAGRPSEHAYTYKLAGQTCLAGDEIGEYSFPEPLEIGSRVVFEDMAHYTMVKNNTFNGIRLPSIALYDPDKDDFRVIREFSYEDYRNRLS
ncbi:MAG: carboxynorspermidine decarboxylase [Candidatus Tantalella remota]|nr:carboxynorspermidine decarboxylase [Candidatus Tantalella remota]